MRALGSSSFPPETWMAATVENLLQSLLGVGKSMQEHGCDSF